MTYDEIVAAAKAYADRQDLEVDSNFDIFITLAEARINRVLKTRKQSTRSYISTTEDKEYYCLPADYLSMRDIQVNSQGPGSSSSPVTFKNPEQFNTQRNLPFGSKYYYCVIANQIQIYPTLEPPCTIEMVYYQKVPHLDADNESNWLADDHPDIYISGIISEIELFVKNYDTATLWRERMTGAIDELEVTDTKEVWGGPSLVMRAQP